MHSAPSISAAKKRFLGEDSKLRGILNEMEPALGDKLAAAIERTLPGTEKPRKDAGIVGPGTAGQSR